MNSPLSRASHARFLRCDLKRLSSISCFLFGATLAALTLGAQTTYSGLTDIPAPPTVAPGTPAGSYALSNLDTVNLYSGRLNAFIPLWTAGGRGDVSIPIGASPVLQWSAKIPSSPSAGPIIPDTSMTRPSFWPGSLKYKENQQQQTCSSGSPIVTSTLARFEFQEFDGTSHELRDKQTNGAPANTGTTCGEGVYSAFNRGTVFVSSDGSNLTFTADLAILDKPNGTESFSGGYLVDKHGTTYRIDSFGTIAWVRDRNGNVTSFAYDSAHLNLTSVTDPLGRTLTISAPPTSPGTQTLSYSGFNGTARTITVTYDLMSDSLVRGGAALEEVKQLFPESAWTNPASNSEVFDALLISKITLPDGTAYQFLYNIYGELARLVLPTGGYYEYDWGSGWPGSADGMAQTSTVVLRRVTARREYDTGGVLKSSTSYAFTSSTSPSPIGSTIVTVTHMDGSSHAISVDKHSFYAPPLADIAIGSEAYADWQEGHEFLTQYYDASGSTLLRSEAMTWMQRDPSTNQTIVPSSFQTKPQDARVTEHDTTLENGQESHVSYTYSVDSANNVTDQYNYDWDNATLLRHTQTAFNTSYATILDLPSEKKIYDGTGALMADTQYAYDGSALEPESSITGYDSSVGAARGNLTSLRQCVNTSVGCNWTSNTSTLLTTLVRDVAGNVWSVTNPRGYTTTFTYSDPQNTYAHMTNRTDALSQTSTWAYDYYSGKPTSATDINSVSTTYSYADPSSGMIDPLDRVRVIAAASSTPAEDDIYVNYTSPTEVNIYQSQGASNDGALRTQNIYDGFGRQLESRSYTGSSVYRSTPQTYDPLGRIATITNEIGYTTQYQYDALGRINSVETPDSAVTTTSYAGNVTTTTDPASKQRKTTTDALARLTAVVEDPSGLNYSTTYKYDGLDDLKSVTQGAQTRTFTYDSLTRLATATNPESGSITYTYDQDGNTLTRKDANLATTSYTYDALDRLQTKAYPSGTPGVTYTYCNGCGLQYGRGRLQSVTTAAGNSTAYTSYSAAGQVQGQTQTIVTSAGTNTYATRL